MDVLDDHPGATDGAFTIPSDPASAFLGSAPCIQSRPHFPIAACSAHGTFVPVGGKSSQAHCAATFCPKPAHDLCVSTGVQALQEVAVQTRGQCGQECGGSGAGRHADAVHIEY